MIEEFWQTLTEEQRQTIQEVVFSLAPLGFAPEKVMRDLLYALSEDWRKKQMAEYIRRMGLVVK